MSTRFQSTPFFPPARACYAVAFLATVISTSLQCCTALAQKPQPGHSRTANASPEPSPSGEAQARVFEQLARAIDGLESDVPRMRERFGQNNPRVIEAQKELAKLQDLRNRFLQLTQGELSETKKADMSRLRDEISAATAFKPTASPESFSDQSAEMRQQIQQMRSQLAEREKQMAIMANQLAEQRRGPMPPLENGTLKIYRLLYANARDGANSVESLFGTQSLRVAVDERSNSLLIYGKPEIVGTVDALLNRLDEQASPNRSEKKSTGSVSPRSLMLRVFWLADSVPETVGQNPADFLPKSVLEATRKLGLEAPRLVTQTVNALATGKDDSVDFSSSVPALLMDQAIGMTCQGKLKWVADDRVRLDMAVRVGGQIDLQGSMATPLGHYMVLGTANSMIAESGPMAGGMTGGPGMGMGRGPMGPRGGIGGPGSFGPGPEPGAAPAPEAAAPGAAGPEGEFSGPPDPSAGPGGAAIGQPVKKKYETSRFAFVIQVIEGQSYGAEKAKPERE
jgi:hypothetical protein